MHPVSHSNSTYSCNPQQGHLSSLGCFTGFPQHLSMLISFHKIPVKKLGKAVIPILKTRVRSREVENMTALCRDTPSISGLERVLH